MEQKILKVGDVIKLKGKKYRAEPEVEKCTCIGCDLYDDGESLCGDRFPCGGHLIFKEVKDVPRRHIELGVVKVEGDKVTFKIVEQTHRGKEFNQQTAPDTFKASNGIELASVSSPAWGGANRLCCCGFLSNKDSIEIVCTTAEFAKISEAVSEYNITDGKGYEKPWPITCDSYYYVNENCTVGCNTFNACDYDCELQKLGNFFRTEEEALAAADKVKTLLKELAAK